MAHKLVIIGANAAGMSCAMETRRQNPDMQIKVFDKSAYISYGACPMPYLLNGKVDDVKKIFARPVEYFEKKDIQINTLCEVVNINSVQKKIEYKKNGELFEESFDKLMIATGSKPRELPFHKSQKNVFHFLKMEDTLGVLDYMKNNDVKRIVVIGGGYIGVEVGECLAESGRDVDVIEMGTILNVFDDDIKKEIKVRLKNRERLSIHENTSVKGFRGSSERVNGVELENGEVIPADMVIVSAGVLPNVDLAKDAGIRLGESGAIEINKKGQTSNYNIFAGGDCAEIYNCILKRNVYLPLGTNANRAGKTIGRNMDVASNEFSIIGTSMLRIGDFEIGATGISENMAKRFGLNVESNMSKFYLKPKYISEESVYIKFIIDKFSRMLIGAQVIGDNNVHGIVNNISSIIHNRMKVDEIENIDMGYHPLMAGLWDPIILMARKFR